MKDKTLNWPMALVVVAIIGAVVAVALKQPAQITAVVAGLGVAIAAFLSMFKGGGGAAVFALACAIGVSACAHGLTQAGQKKIDSYEELLKQCSKGALDEGVERGQAAAASYFDKCTEGKGPPAAADAGSP